MPPHLLTAHTGSHGETGAFWMGGGITTLGAFCAVRKPCVAGCQNGKLCRFWALVGCTPKERRKPSEQRCVHARRCPEASRPRWAALSLPVIVHRRALGVCHRCDKGQRTLLAGLLSFCLRCRGFFFSYSGAFFEPLFASIHARNLSFGTTIRLPILSAGNSLPCTNS